MTVLTDVQSQKDGVFEPYTWVGQVLDHFARGEQALGRLTLALGLNIENGSLSSLADVRRRLKASGHKKAKMLEQRIARWCANRPMRHLLAHATITTLFDAKGQMVLITRHLPLDATDVTPDRMWTGEEQKELLRQASNDGRSISDHVRDILADGTLTTMLKSL